MAIALEELSPEAGAAVGAAAAGHGVKLSPAVKDELVKKAARKAPAGNTAPSPTIAIPGGGVVHYAAGSLKAAAKTSTAAAVQVGQRATGAPSPVIRIVLAFGAFLVALELASYLSGRYFTYNIGKGVVKAQAVTQSIGLYPGQAAKLALPAPAPALPHYGTVTM